MPALCFAGRASTLDEEMAIKMLARSTEKERLSCIIVKLLPERNDASPSGQDERKEREEQNGHPAEERSREEKVETGWT
jgi:hypothetical protein